jgi:hypothetical protein
MKNKLNNHEKIKLILILLVKHLMKSIKNNHEK